MKENKKLLIKKLLTQKEKLLKKRQKNDYKEIGEKSLINTFNIKDI